MNKEKFDLAQYISHHSGNSYEWHLPFLPPIPLPKWLSLHGLMLLIASFVLIVVFCLCYDKKKKVPQGFTNILELMIIFVRDEIVTPYLGKEDGMRMTPLFCTLFFLILTSNLMGLIPLFTSATSNVNVTGALAFITLLFMTVGAMHKNGVGGFFRALIPPEVPVWTLVLIFPTELLGVFIKSFVLMVRLFANIYAGHLVLMTVIGIIVMFGIAALPALTLVVFVYLLEVFVAFLQAYIFTLLSAIFIGHMYYPEH